MSNYKHPLEGVQQHFIKKHYFTFCQWEDLAHTISCIPHFVEVTRLSEKFDEFNMRIIVIRITCHLKI